MPLSPGDRIGPYEILAPIGRGGMGEVWRGRDGKLQRDVAIKALPDEFRQDAERRARFEREARLLATLNHSRIASIYGLEEKDDATYLVMELVEGSTLAERLAAGPLPVDEALAVGEGIAEALEAAHGAGILHRDVKPANVKVRPDGSVKLLDLGLARSFETRGASDSSFSPTITTPATMAGVVLGTAAYMSPEQARGRPLDRRSDIFSFGCVLYESLTGRQAFRGETVTDTLAAILKSEPEWDALPAATPRKARELLRRCLQKDPRRRLHDVADARIELEEARAEERTEGEAESGRRPVGTIGGRLAWGLAGALLGAAVAAGVFFLRRPSAKESLPVVHASIPLPAGMGLWVRRPSIAISPDGRTLVFAAARDGAQQLFRRALGGSAVEQIPGTELGSRPFFSPDGEWIGFFAGNQLKKVPVSGGSSVLLLNVPPVTAGATWGADGRIVFTFGVNSGLFTLPASGGPSRALTRLDTARGEHAHLYPQILPDGRGILATVRTGRDFSDLENSRIAVLDPAKGTWRTVLEGSSFARYAAGRLFFVRGNAVFTASFDPARLAVTGAPVRLDEPIVLDPSEGIAHLAVAEDGTLAFVEGAAVQAPTTAAVWIDRGGRETPIPLPPASYYFPRLSPDGRRLALVRFSGLRSSVIVYDRERRLVSTLTPEPGRFFAPVWSPDGKRVVFSRQTSARPTLGLKNADGSGDIRALNSPSEDAEFASSWSPDGKTIAYTVNYTADRTASRRLLSADIWLASADGKSPSRPWFETPFRETSPAFSPDGKWVAYVSDESGTREISVRRFPGPGAAIKISESGLEPIWTRDGRELIYRSGERGETFSSIEIRTSPELSISEPRRLFTSDLNLGGQWLGAQSRDEGFHDYDVSADGNVIVGTRLVGVAEPARGIQIVTNWAAASGRR